MGFNYAKEKAKFDIGWKTLRAEYEKAGMSEEAISTMYDYDWELFCADRVWDAHNQSLPNSFLADEDTWQSSTLFQKFASLSVTFNETDFHNRYAWVDAIDDFRLAERLKNLSAKDLELLTFIVLEQHSQAELAHKWGCSQRAVSRRFQQIKKNFQKPV